MELVYFLVQREDEEPRVLNAFDKIVASDPGRLPTSMKMTCGPCVAK
jgi:hypothetical protein